MSRSTPAVRVVERYALSPAEAAEALGICRASIYNAMARGEIRATKIGRSTRIPITEIERLLSEAA